MTIVTKYKPGKEFTPLPPGSHVAICDGVIHIGIEKTKYGPRDLIILRWEVPSERVEYKKDFKEVNEPATIMAWYSNSLHEKATLREHLESWFGRTLIAEELQGGIDWPCLVGQAGYITVKHETKGDKTTAKVTSVAKVPPGVPIPDQELPSILFGPDDTDQYDDLPKFLQDKFDEAERPPDDEPAPKQSELSIGDKANGATKPLTSSTPARHVTEIITGRRASQSDFVDDDIPFKPEAA